MLIGSSSAPHAGAELEYNDRTYAKNSCACSGIAFTKMMTRSWLLMGMFRTDLLPLTCVDTYGRRDEFVGSSKQDKDTYPGDLLSMTTYWKEDLNGRGGSCVADRHDT